MAKKTEELANPFEREAAVKAKAQKDLDKLLAISEASAKKVDEDDQDDGPEDGEEQK